MSENIMEKLTIRPLNDVSEKLSKRANEHEVRIGTLSALTERCNRLETENAELRKLSREMYPYAKAFLQQGVMLGCNDAESYGWFLQLQELGIEV